MLYLDEAILTRWNAKGLNTSIAPLYDHQQPEGSALPYCSFSNVSDRKAHQTVASRYQEAMVQFELWHTSKEACGALCELIEQGFINANRASTNALAVPQPDGIVSCILITPYILLQISDTVWQGPQTFKILYRRDGDLTPP